MFDPPERCLLSQALLWISRGLRPVPDVAFIAAAPEFEGSDYNFSIPLIRALRLGKFEVEGRLKVILCQPIGDREVKMGLPISFEYSPPFSEFTKRNIDFESNVVDVNDDFDDDLMFEKKYEEIYKKIESSSGEKVNLHALRWYFHDVTISTKTLFELFPKDVKPSSDQPKELAAPRAKPGAPPKYNWDLIWAELVVRADLDNMPESQAECIRQMSEWCMDRFNESPSETVWKEKLRFVYRHHRKGGN